MMPWLLASAWLAVLAVNVPFGFWREGVKKFSLRWFLAVHAPVPIVVALRLALGLGWRPSTFLLLVTAYFGGQFVGGRLRRARAGH